MIIRICGCECLNLLAPFSDCKPGLIMNPCRTYARAARSVTLYDRANYHVPCHAIEQHAEQLSIMPSSEWHRPCLSCCAKKRGSYMVTARNRHVTWSMSMSGPCQRLARSTSSRRKFGQHPAKATFKAIISLLHAVQKGDPTFWHVLGKEDRPDG